MELLRVGDRKGLENLVAGEPRTVRHLLGRLWDNDDDLREMAAFGLGAVAAHHPAQARDVARRLMWALADEAAMNGVYGMAAMGEMGVRAPDVIEPFVAPMVSHLWDEGLRNEILKAVRRMVGEHPELTDAIRPMLERESGAFDADDRDLVAAILNTQESGGQYEH